MKITIEGMPGPGMEDYSRTYAIDNEHIEEISLTDHAPRSFDRNELAELAIKVTFRCPLIEGETVLPTLPTGTALPTLELPSCPD